MRLYDTIQAVAVKWLPIFIPLSFLSSKNALETSPSLSLRKNFSPANFYGLGFNLLKWDRVNLILIVFMSFRTRRLNLEQFKKPWPKYIFYLFSSSPTHRCLFLILFFAIKTLLESPSAFQWNLLHQEVEANSRHWDSFALSWLTLINSSFLCPIWAQSVFH